MPINRNGKHWCAPEQEQPDEEGQWTCPDCGQKWLHTTELGYPLWETPESRESRIESQIQADNQLKLEEL